MIKKVKKVKVGDPFDPKNGQGPQVSQEQFDRISPTSRPARIRAAKLLTGRGGSANRATSSSPPSSAMSPMTCRSPAKKSSGRDVDHPLQGYR